MGFNYFRIVSIRFYSFGSRSTISDHPWLSQPLEAFAPKTTSVVNKNAFVHSKKGASSTQVTALSNGVRVATQQSSGNFCTLGVGVNAGSRYEMFSPSGVTHFLEKMAFSSTANYNSKDDILQTLAQHGGICDCQFSRDVAFYALSISNKSVQTGLDILSQAVLHPKLTSEELEMSRSLVYFDLLDHEESLARMQPDILLHDMIHRAAFRGNTVGLPKFCPKEHVDKIKRDDLSSFLATYMEAERTVIAGVGLDHDELCKLVETMFNFEDSSYKDAKLLEVDESLGQYTGGELRIDKRLTPVTGGDNPLPELAHVVIGLESVSSLHEDYVTATVLSFLMGGGSSFSAGGPGKGMYSRMYLNVLNRHYYVQHASVLNFPYSDCGLFALQLSCEPERVRDTCAVGVKELLNMVQSQIDSEELERAKNQLKAMMFANLEAKPVQMEDIARQILSQGFKREPSDICDMIDSVTKQDIVRVAEKLIGSKISVAALGQVGEVPSQRDMTHAFINNGKFPQTQKSSKFKLF
ncbi:mitochondrial-processing peptidase subunit alpha-like [Convolutriloba macropyga]|uniref:mitochondrial-processing peptidase subunit alpha-like n=1 Tax=Convolutriloba macropyga TaxID=536237 RepID=UPI003F526AEC